MGNMFIDCGVPPKILPQNLYNRMEMEVVKAISREPMQELRPQICSVKQILNDIDPQMVGRLSGAEFNAEVAEVRAALANEVTELEETVLFTAAEQGHIDVVKELLKYSNKEALTKKNRSAFDPLHVAASQGHLGDNRRFP
ncbi:hypothetical protein Nepgr_028735 [Nepenthes gracilis]|uniref:Uncharacterized protein n=1 Tax=Nepenthes gracilis TaxID=150966 RepID=A0AAD3Y2D5_NEPGR|nr:hypothetical protein Nepgr_028735 [Nepenthes gracilis]